MKIIFLGTNGWYDTKTGNTSCTLIETRKEYIILDAGGGLYKIDRYIKTKKPIRLFLSHFHLDHIIGLHTLNRFNFPQGIDVFGPPGLKECFHRVINEPYSLPVKKLRTRIRLNKLDKSKKIPINVNFKELKHSQLCYGYRFLLEGRVISYCTDTGLCKNLSSLARAADILIAECSLRSGQRNGLWPHLNPENAATVAKEARVKRLFLVHFDASLYLTIKDRKEAERTTRTIFKNTFAATDGLNLSLRSQGK